MNNVKQMLPLVVAVVVLLVAFRLSFQDFLGLENMLDLAQQISVNAIIAFGMTLTILIGGIDLSVGAMLALVGTTTAYLMSHAELAGGLSGWKGTLLAVAAGVAVSLLFGAFNGLCAARTKMPPFIITLATMLMARGCALRFNEGRPMSIPRTEEAFLDLGNGRVADIMPIPVLVMLGVFVAMAILLHRTRFGQYVYAMGGNRLAARYTGLPLVRVEILVYTLCSALAGLAGLIQTSQLYSGVPASGEGFELNAIAAAVVGGTSFTGGRGSMVGTLLGAVIIGVLNKGLNQAGVHFSYQKIIMGLVILIAVYIDIRRRES